MIIERTVSIGASPPAVWELITDPGRLTEWMPSVVGFDTDDEATPRVGTVSTMRIKEGGREVDYQSEILAFDPPTHLVVEMRGGGLGPTPMRIRYDLAERDGRTELAYRSEWQAGTVFLKLMTPLITWAAGRNADQALDRLTQVAQQGAGPGRDV